MKEHNTNLALQLVPASSRPRVVGEPRLWIAEALEVCDTSVVARRLSCSQELVRGWRTGKSLPNLDHLARAPRRFSLRVLTCLGDHLRADQIAHQDLDEALRLLYLAFGALLAGWWGHRWTLEQVRDLLGHRSVTTTERYAHLAPSVLAETAAQTNLGRSREGHAAIIRNHPERSKEADFSGVLWGRATHDSNVRPSAPEGEAKNIGFPGVRPSRDQAVTRASVAFLQAVAAGEGGAVLAELARGLATVVLEIPEVVLAKRIQAALVSRSPLLVAIATQLAERLLSPEVVEGAGEEVAS